MTLATSHLFVKWHRYIELKKMFKKFFLASATLLLVSACASRPEAISASYVSHEKYMDNDCTQLATKMTDARAELAKVSAMQDSKANGDAVGVLLVLIPVSKLTGDHAGDVARWKGEVEAIDTAQIKMKCKS